MINNLEGKSAKELREIILIQQEEYKKLLDENKELESQVKAQQSCIGSALGKSKKQLISRIADLERGRDELKVSLDCQIMKKEHSFKRESQLMSENLDLKRKTFRNYDNQEYWIFQDDGEDYPESIVCPVVMSADQFRRLLGLEMTLKARNLEQHAKGVSDFFSYHKPRISMGKSAIWEVNNSQVESYLAEKLKQAKENDCE